jgi:hypothetical protein
MHSSSSSHWLLSGGHQSPSRQSSILLFWTEAYRCMIRHNTGINRWLIKDQRSGMRLYIMTRFSKTMGVAADTLFQCNSDVFKLKKQKIVLPSRVRAANPIPLPFRIRNLTCSRLWHRSPKLFRHHLTLPSSISFSLPIPSFAGTFTIPVWSTVEDFFKFIAFS